LPLTVHPCIFSAVTSSFAFLDRPSRALGTLVMVGAVAMAGTGCRPKDPALSGPWRDDFERSVLGPDWRDTGGGYTVAGGKLWAATAHNHPLWLARRLPADLVVEVDVASTSPDGDIKMELFGDGASFDPDMGEYTSTGYVFVFGGWHNALSVICKGNEHGEGRKAERGDRKVVPNQTYHWTIRRHDGLLVWEVDREPFLSWRDPAPLAGSDHAYLAVNDWETRVSFDNLVIQPVAP